MRLPYARTNPTSASAFPIMRRYRPGLAAMLSLFVAALPTLALAQGGPTPAAQPPPGFEPQQPAQPAQPAQPTQPMQPGGGPPPMYYPPPGSGPQLGPKRLDYEEGQPVPPGYHVTSRARRGFVIGGAATLGAGFIITVFSGLVLQIACGVSTIDSTTNSPSGWHGSCSDVAWIYVPVAGPFITMATARPSSAGTMVYLAILGGVQTAGLGMLIAGLASREQYLERNDLGKTKIRVAPTIGKDSLSLSLIGNM